MDAPAGGFIRTVLHQQQPADRDSSLAVPSDERLKASGLQLQQRSLRLRQQVNLAMARRKSSAGSLQQALVSPEQASEKPLFDYFTVPLPGNYSYSQHQTSVSYGGDPGQINQALHSSSETRRFLSQGLQSQATKPSCRIEVAVDDSPVLVRSHLRKEGRYPSRGRGGRIRALSYRQGSPSAEVALGRWQSARPILRHNSKYMQSEVFCFLRAPQIVRSWSHPAQQRARPAPEEPWSPDSVFLHGLAPDRAVQQHSILDRSSFGRNQIGSLEQQLQGVSLSCHSNSQSRLDYAVNRYNWNQTSAQSSSSNHGNVAVTQESAPAEISTLQAQNNCETPVCQENHESQAAVVNASASVSADDSGEWTMETAVSALTHDNLDSVVYGANFIQHECFQRPEAKKELYELDGISKLITLLSSKEVEVQRSVCGAIRNGVFEENDSKVEVKDHDGVQKLVQLLGQTKDIETKKQITGLMWNLSSNEHLKSELIEKALHPLTTSIIIPYSGWPEGDVKSFDLDPDIFYNTTGCLRNLSSASPEGRKQMRECEGLIDSLVLYIQFTIANNQEDDKSTENATCVLHNLSFQLENELPSAYTESLGWKSNPLTQRKSAGCFGARSSRLKEEGVNSACIEEKRNPQGVEWLWHSLVVRMYLSLIARSSHTCTQEASLGALQNLTASTGPMGSTITETITTKENGLQHIRRTLHSREPSVQKAAVSLLRNMARNPRVHNELANLIMPDLLAILPEPGESPAMPDDTAGLICQVLYNLIQNKGQNARNLLKEDGLGKIVEVSRRSQNAPSNAGKAASNLLYNLWLFRDLHSAYKKAGFTKSDFINSRTTKAYHSLRDQKPLI